MRLKSAMWWLLVLLPPLMSWTCSDQGNQAFEHVFQLDAETAENVAAALWLQEYNPGMVPPEIAERIGRETNSNTAFGRRMHRRLLYLLANPDSFTPDYGELYTELAKHTTLLTPHQAYAMSNLLGLDSSRGYQELPRNISFTFPEDDRPQVEYQVGWHFFVGSAFSEEGHEFGIEMMFWSCSLLPPDMARSLGLSDMENQVAEMHFAITLAGDRHYRAKPTVVAGTTGLITFSSAPFRYTLGRNLISSLRADSLFPLELRAWGVDRTEGSPVEIEMDLFVNQTKGYVLQGDAGLSPSCGGVGTLYYSVPSLSLEPARSWIKVQGREFRLTGGKMWYDHQWSTGLAPTGNPRSEVLRAAVNVAPRKVPGWDWMEIQFDDDTEISLSSLHRIELSRFYHQTGDVPPGIMVAPAKGIYIDQTGKYSPITGEIRVSEWIRSAVSHDQYLATQTWYPNRVEVTVDEAIVPAEKRAFSMIPIVTAGQQGFFAAGMQYSEGAVYIEKDGSRIGRGFLESTGYADNTRQTLRLAGLPKTDEMLRILATREPSDDLVLRSGQFLAIPENTQRLMEELDACRGL